MTVAELPRALLREDLANASGRDARAAARSGQWRRATHGLARGYVQANMAIVPKRYAFDFMLFCQRNPKPCQVIDFTAPGDKDKTARIRLELFGKEKRLGEIEFGNDPRHSRRRPRCSIASRRDRRENDRDLRKEDVPMLDDER